MLVAVSLLIIVFVLGVLLGALIERHMAQRGPYGPHR